MAVQPTHQVFVLKFSKINSIGVPFVSDPALNECFTLKELYFNQVSFRKVQLCLQTQLSRLETFIFAVYKFLSMAMYSMTL